MRALRLAVLVLLWLQPSRSVVAQRPQRGIPIGARLKLDVSQGRGTEGTLLGWRGDTLIVKSDGRSDTVHIAANVVNSIRIVRSPALWGDTISADITFFGSVAVPLPGGSGSDTNTHYRHLLLVATTAHLAGLDPANGRILWTRTDLGGLKEAALDYLGSTGYGVITRADRMDLVDLRTGQTRWDTRALSITAPRGWLPFAMADSTILMLGRTTESPTTLVAVDVATGKVRWRQNHLFGVEPKVFTASGVPYLLGNQDPISDSDSTLVLYIGAEGPMRLNARSGALLWRSSDLHTGNVSTPRDGYAWMRLRHGMIVIPSEKLLVGMRTTDGHAAWVHACKGKVIRLVWTGYGLLARGEDWIDLLDSGTGKSVWPAPVEVKRSTRMVLRGDTIYIEADKKLLAIQVASGTVQTLASLKFEQGEEPGGIAVFGGSIVLNSWHHVTLFDRHGLQRNHLSYPSPKETFGEALGRASIGTSTRRPATFWGGDDLYFYTGAPDDEQHQGFSLVKFDPAAWREDGRLWFDTRVPAYLVDWSAGLVYYQREDRILEGLTFSDLTAVAEAIRSGNDSQVARMVDMGADVSASGASRWTALHYAAEYDRPVVARLLLAHGAIVDAPAIDGWTPWMVAAAHGHTDVMQILKDAGAHFSDATATLLLGWHLADQGRIAAAESAFVAARGMDSGLAIFPAAWRQLCWSGVLHQDWTAARRACDQAVLHTPPTDDSYVETMLARSITRASTGNLSGAADDLVAIQPQAVKEDETTGFGEWIDALRNGKNPFTAEVLGTLRQP